MQPKLNCIRRNYGNRYMDTKRLNGSSNGRMSSKECKNGW